MTAKKIRHRRAGKKGSVWDDFFVIFTLVACLFDNANSNST
jgi:hypothetical protein